MKVMCINDFFISTLNGERALFYPKVGEVVTVINIKDNGYYLLLEYPTNGFIFSNLCGWNPSKFIPLSNIDETELIKERELVNA